MKVFTPGEVLYQGDNANQFENHWPSLGDGWHIAKDKFTGIFYVCNGIYVKAVVLPGPDLYAGRRAYCEYCRLTYQEARDVDEH